MNSNITTSKSVEPFFYLTGGVGGFLVTIPGRTDIVARADSLIELQENKQYREKNTKYLRHRKVQIIMEIYHVKWHQDGIFLSFLSPVESNQGLVSGLLDYQGGLEVFNHLGNDIYIEDAESITRMQPVIVPVKKELFKEDRVFDKALIEDICSRKTSKLYIDFHYGRGCFQLKFDYSDELVTLIRKVVPFQHVTFTYDDRFWKIDYSAAELIPELIDLMEHELVGV